MDYTKSNSETIDRWARAGWQWGQPVSAAACAKARQGSFDVYLTPTKAVPQAWLGEIRGQKILGLASGGGQQMPLLSCAGAHCTVLDYSKVQLATEAQMAKQEHYDIDIIHYDMTQPLPFPDEHFDLIFHPVSNCYVAEVKPIWQECYRILKPGGRLLAGLDIGVNYIVDETETKIINHLPFNPLKNADQRQQLAAGDFGMQFSHTIEEQVNGQLEAGFILRALFDDTNGEGRLEALNIPTVLATYSEKPK